MRDCNIFITGATGFIGGYLTFILLKENKIAILVRRGSIEITG